MKYHTCWSPHDSVLDGLAEMLGPIIMRLGGQCGVQRWRETSHVLDCHHVRVAWFQELIQHCEYLRVEHLEAADAIHHPFKSLSLKIKCYGDKTMKYFSCRTSDTRSASLELDFNVRIAMHWRHTSRYGRTSRIRINSCCIHWRSDVSQMSSGQGVDLSLLLRRSEERDGYAV